MRLWVPVLLAGALVGTLHAAMVEPGLPSWGEGERALLEEGGWVAGGLLLTDDPIPEEAEPEEVESLDVDQPTAEEIAEQETPPDEIPEKYWSEYFDKRPASFLVDPQGVLSPVVYRDRLGFLNYHASDSSIDLYVYLFKGDQDIPGEVRDEELVERFFSEGRPAAVVFYYMGAPQRSVMYLSPSLTDAVSAAEQRRALDSSVMQAFKDVDPAGQIESFLVQMSIRIYWMERMLNGGDEVASHPAISAGRKAEPDHESALGAMFRNLVERARVYLIPGAVFLGAVLAGGLMGWWLRARARYRFPDFEVEPRLGAAHAAGVGAVISFASASLPPASQRDQVPDYLRRA
jgi:hypothetical protein